MNKGKRKFKIILISIFVYIVANYFLYLYNFVNSSYQNKVPSLMICSKAEEYGRNCIGLGYSISFSQFNHQPDDPYPFSGVVVVKVFGK